MIHKIVAQGIVEQRYSGAVYSVWQNGRECFNGALGVANQQTNDVMTTEHIFDFASLTKLFTTTLVLHHLSNKRLLFEDSLATFQIGPASLGHITVAQLLQHHSGLIAWYPFYEQNMRGYSFEQALAHIEKVCPYEQEQMVYSDLNFMLLRTICEKVDVRPFEQQIAFVLQEIGDEDAFFGQQKRPQKIVATEYGNQIEQKMCSDRGFHFDNWRSTKMPIVAEVNDGNCFYFFNGVSGHAGMFGSKNTLLKLGQLYLKGGGSLIDAELVNKVFSDGKNGRTWGFSKEGIFKKGIGHTGFTGTMLYIEPGSDLIIVFLTNRLHVKSPGDITDVRKKIIESIH